MGLHEDALARQRDNEERVRLAAESAKLRATPHVFSQVIELVELCRQHGLEPVELFQEIRTSSVRTFESTGELGWVANLHHPLGKKPILGQHGIAFSEQGHVWAYAVYEKFEGFLSNGPTKGLPKPGAWVVSQPDTFSSPDGNPLMSLDVEDAASEVLAGRAIGCMIPMSEYTRSRYEPSGRN